MADVLLANGVDCLPGGAGYFLVNVDPSVICGNVRVTGVGAGLVGVLDCMQRFGRVALAVSAA